MKRTLILTLAVLLGALAVCVASLTALNGVVDEAERLEWQASEAARAGRPDDARAQVEALAAFWAERANLMELLASHDDLHDVDAAIAEARLCLRFGDLEDFQRAMSTARAGLQHLKDEEALRLSNLY